MVQVPDFDALYRADPDPWQVASSFYEQRKLDLLLASLTRQRYAAAWDPACGTGELAARLVARADGVLATDGAAEAVRLTARRCVDLPRVAVGQLCQPALPTPARRFDLVVVAEFAYYLPAEDRRALWKVLDTATGNAPGQAVDEHHATRHAELVVVHWRHRPHDGYLSGLEVNAEASRHLTAAGWAHAVRHDDRDFVLDVLAWEDR